MTDIWDKWAPELTELGQQLVQQFRVLLIDVNWSKYGFGPDFLALIPNNLKNQAQEDSLTSSGFVVYLFAELLQRTFFQKSLIDEGYKRVQILLLIELYLHHDHLFDEDPIQAMHYSANLPKSLTRGIQRFLALNPNIEDYLKLAVSAELSSAVKQYSRDYSLADYKKWTEDKGGYLAVLIGQILGIKDHNSDLYTIGAIIQHIDDILDFQEDAEHAITTYCISYYQSYKNLDRLVTKIGAKISCLDSKFNLFKIVLTQSLIYAVLNTGLISETLKKNLSKRCYLQQRPLGEYFAFVNQLLRKDVGHRN